MVLVWFILPGRGLQRICPSPKLKQTIQPRNDDYDDGRKEKLTRLYACGAKVHITYIVAGTAAASLGMNAV